MKTPYFPAPVRGQTFPHHIRINRRQLQRYMEQGKPFAGFVVGNKVHTSHFFGGWHLAHTVTASLWSEMEEHLNSFLFYLEPELGNSAAIFLKVETAL